VLLVGAGDAGAALLRDMDRGTSNLTPVALLDDDPRKHGRRVGGVVVAGFVHDLPAVAAQHRADQVLLAVPTADHSLVRQVADLSEKARLPLRVLPPVQELAGGRVGLRDVRDVDIQDLLGRAQIETDLQAVRDLVAGKVVLVTGAGGSIGSEICRQVASFRPRRLLLLDHDETHLFDVAATLPRSAVQILADIRDRARINAIFARHRPDVVFHAAAHKHVPLLEAHPAEAVRTNVTGTDAVVQAAVATRTDRFVFISTDKAVEPSSIMGASKRLGERLVLAAQGPGQAFCAVRFGNVLGSRGSVVPTFLEQIKRGGPVTVTDGRMTRYFMSIPEAVQLVLQAAALSRGGEIFMLDMGESVNIKELAERLIRLSGQRPGVDIEIRVTGIRPGEKMHESLHAAAENPQPTTHPSVLRLTPTAMSSCLLRQAVESLMLLTDHGRSDDARQLLVDLARGRGERHLDGLLQLAHRRRSEDRGDDPAQPRQGSPRRRLADVLSVPSQPQRPRVELSTPRSAESLEPLPAWTSSTT
jgi:FlaA1/EpsC-like NDP-sugar epimerase